MHGKEATAMEKKGISQPGKQAAQQRAAGSQLASPGPTVRAARAKRPGAPSSRKPSGRRTRQQLIGQRAEDIAVDFLRARGLQILERNFRRRLGELDIVARDGDVLVIVEVRSRASDRFGGAAASVDSRKQKRLVRAAAQLLQQRRDFSHLPVRFDVISVSETAVVSPRVEWFQHAFLT
jgi:putative endonuclease